MVTLIAKWLKIQRRWTCLVVTVSALPSTTGGITNIPLGIKLVVHRHLKNPVEKLAKDVQRNIVKTVMADLGDAYSANGHGDEGENEGHPRVLTSARDVNDNTNLALRTKTSRRSIDSSHSKSSRKLPEFAPAAPKKGEDDDEDKDFDVHGFDHPSAYAEQPWIWVPRDELGLSHYFVSDFRASGVEASDDGATMDVKGDVEVNRSPPDEDWIGGHDA